MGGRRYRHKGETVSADAADSDRSLVPQFDWWRETRKLSCSSRLLTTRARQKSRQCFMSIGDLQWLRTWTLSLAETRGGCDLVGERVVPSVYV